jgi:hypothetical protein
LKLCEDINFTTEIFEPESSRTQSLLKLIDTYIIGTPGEILEEQKLIIYGYIKNDFILFNWGPLAAIEEMLRVKGKEFIEYLKIEEVQLHET